MLTLRPAHEEYLKAIYLISRKKKGGWVSNSDISQALQVYPSSVTDMLYKLRDLKLISWKPRNSIRLTELGKLMAVDKIKSFYLLKNFFLRYLDIRDDSFLDSLCCKIEHHLTPEILQVFEKCYKEGDLSG